MEMDKGYVMYYERETAADEMKKNLRKENYAPFCVQLVIKKSLRDL